jgi:hypothetical protein
MLSGAGGHLSEEQLARVQDGDGVEAEVAHVAHCAECAARLRQWDVTAAAYAEYRDTIRGPSLPPVPEPWPSLERLIAGHEVEPRRTGELAETSRPHRMRWWIPAFAAAVVAISIGVALIPRTDRQSARADQLLDRASFAPVRGNRVISIQARGRLLVRPAVLSSDEVGATDAEMARLQALFRAANYGWRDPLSPRTFQAWRGNQRNRRDSVSLISGHGGQRLYRVRTEVPAGALRSAALTLRTEDLESTGGEFAFAGEAPVSMEAAAATPLPANPPSPGLPADEVAASPADTLHVLAALDEIGADAGEPLDVGEDASHRHVVVRAGGLAPERQRQIAKALAPLPRVVVDLESGPAHTVPIPLVAPQSYNSDIPPSLRQRFEERLGGAVAVQETTDRTLEASSLLLARVHAMEVLASNFPPEIEGRFSPPDRLLLRSLRQRHTQEMERSLAQIRESLKPLLEPTGTAIPPPDAGASWQSHVPSLAAAARQADELLNHLLAGSYSQAAGEGMLKTLTPAIERLPEEVRAQRQGE